MLKHMSSHFFDDEVAREAYMSKLQEDQQSKIVTVRSGLSITHCELIWTHRNTGCDVISTVVTTIPLKSGNMKDIKMYNKEMRRIKGPGKKSGLHSMHNPFESSSSAEDDRAKKYCDRILKAERNAFLQRLYTTRFMRGTIENTSAVLIQKIFRGHYTRSRLPQIIMRCRIHQHLRQQLREQMSNRGFYFATLQEHKLTYKGLRRKCAITIQCSFRSFLSRMFVRRLRRELSVKRRHDAATCIQKMARRVSAKERVRQRRERYHLMRTYNGALRIQMCYRRYIARRKTSHRKYILRWVAARMIQSAFRSKRSQVFVAMTKQEIIKFKQFKGARGFQRIIRGFLGRRRYTRIALRHTYLRVFRSTARIQCIIRGFVARRRVRKLLSAREVQLQKEKDRIKAAEDLEKYKLENEEAQRLADSMSAFVQAMKGNSTAWSDLYHHEVEAQGKSTVNSEVDTEGNTILSVAAAHGHVDIVRKCLQLGFDSNHVNSAGDSVIALAANHDQMEVVIYLLKNGPSAEVKLNYSVEDFAIALNSAARHDSITYLRTLLELAPDFVNASHPVTGFTALHSACECGHLENVKLLLKYKADATILDGTDQRALHRAASSSLPIVKMLANLESAGDELTASQRLLLRDEDGKDCALIAALSGHADILTYVQEVIGKGSKEEYGDIGWGPIDIENSHKLVEQENISSLKYIVNAGFDLSWTLDNGTTLAMTACKHGKLKCLDYLLEQGVDLTVLNEQKRCAIHFAAECAEEAVLPFLFTHKKSKDCKATPDMLTACDDFGWTPLHIAAKYGSSLSVELIADGHLQKAVNMQDRLGMTPLMIACAFYQPNKILELLRFESNASLLDNNGHNALWHYTHPHTPNVTEPSSPNRIRVGDADANMKVDVEIVGALLRHGCAPFATASTFSTLIERKDTYDRANTGGCIDRSMLEALDIMAIDGNVALFKGLPSILSECDLWLAVLTSLYFDNSAKSFIALIENGGAATLGKNIAAKHDKTADIPFLRHIYHGGMNVVGWSIRSHNSAALKYLYKNGISPAHHIDIHGNNSLHYVARYGLPNHLDIIDDTDDVVIFEARNDCGFTAAMEGARSGNSKTVLQLCKRGAHARTALKGHYAAYILAFARQKEKCEKNTQTGRVGDDDMKWSPMSPDPDYMFWLESV